MEKVGRELFLTLVNQQKPGIKPFIVAASELAIPNSRGQEPHLSFGHTGINGHFHMALAHRGELRFKPFRDD